MLGESKNPDALSLLDGLVKKAKAAGADMADAMQVESASISVGVRLGEVEALERSESSALDLRVIIGKKQAIASTTDHRPRALDELVSRTVSMARAAPEDEFCGLAATEAIARTWPSVESADDAMPSTEHLIAETRRMEDAARQVKGVTNSEGAEASAGASTIALVASNGFAGSRRRTHYSLSAAILAGDGTGMERDYDYASRVFAADLPPADAIGKQAAERAVRKLNPRKMPTAHVPVVFEPRIAGTILGHLSGAISGTSIARGTSFLKDRLGHKIFAEGVSVFDDPLRPRGLRSYPFDGEGLPPQQRTIIDKGVLTTWILDLRSARQLKMNSTAHASRSPGSLPSPSPSNFYLAPGRMSARELMSDIKQGFYVTELMGSGVNGVTGDYSRAAAGFWIESGTIAFPVSEVTIAGNLKDMFLNLTPASDLEFFYGFDAPTLRIEGMTVAGL
ncbi:MAG: TldD/PmbA family protein [Bdellovibrionales bacterium]